MKIEGLGPNIRGYPVIGFVGVTLVVWRLNIFLPPENLLAVVSDDAFYFSDRAVYNLDGLINSFEVYQTIRDCDLCSIFEEWGIDYFASILPTDLPLTDYEVQIAFPPWHPSTTIRVQDEIEQFRSKPSGRFAMGVWKYQPDMCMGTQSTIQQLSG